MAVEVKLLPRADVTVHEEVARMVEETMKKYGRIDILVNNVNLGPYILKPFERLTWNDLSQKLHDEMKAAFNVTKEVIPIMKKQHYGSIIYIATASAKHPVPPGAIIAGTSKAALVAFAKYIAQEFGRESPFFLMNLDKKLIL